MTIGITDSKHYEDIADAIREKTGRTNELAPGEMAKAIDGILAAEDAQATIDGIITRSITEVTSMTTRIGYSAFQYCDQLESADFPNVTDIGENAFYCCYKLTSVDIPNATIIRSNAFYCCNQLESADFPNVTIINSCAFQNSRLTIVDFPNATNIGTSVFRDCRKLTIAVFPNATNIGVYAFQNSTLTTLVIGSEDSTSVCTLGNTSTLPSQTQIYVPDHLLDDYKTATNWSAIASRIHPQSELPADEEE